MERRGHGAGPVGPLYIVERKYILVGRESNLREPLFVDRETTVHQRAGSLGSAPDSARQCRQVSARTWVCFLRTTDTLNLWKYIIEQRAPATYTPPRSRRLPLRSDDQRPAGSSRPSAITRRGRCTLSLSPLSILSMRTRAPISVFAQIFPEANGQRAGDGHPCCQATPLHG
jgi:hypothetical protein